MNDRHKILLHRILEAGGSSWYVEPVPDVNFIVKKTHLGDFSCDADTLLPVMLLDGEHSDDDTDWIMKTFRDIQDDRTFHDAFSSCVFLKKSGQEDLKVADQDIELLCQQGCRTVVEVKTSEREGAPHRKDWIYCMFGVNLHRVFRLFDDPYGAFVCGIVHDQKDPSHYTTQNQVQSGNMLLPDEKRFQKLSDPRIPVPHHQNDVYQWSMDKALLKGKTIAIKDVFDIAGFPTTVSSKAYTALYGDAKTTASLIDRLTSVGAIIVGKTKTSQFASGENAMDWNDFQCPFNPRGDGSFESYCSSTGSAAAVAAYDWIDAAIGSDTLGSIIQPAAGHGIFGLRPTWGSLESTGCLKVSTLLDTIGPFARSVDTLRALTECLFGTRASRSQEFRLPEVEKFARILYPSELFEAHLQEKRDELNSFIDDILTTNQNIDREKKVFDIDAEWREARITDPTISIKDYLHRTLSHIQLCDSYRNNLQFVEDYRKKHGHDPLVNKMVKYKWAAGSRLTNQQYSDACWQQAKFKEFLKRILENDILVLPANSPALAYREGSDQIPTELRASNLQGVGFDLHQCSFLGGFPELVVPIAQVPVISSTTGKHTFEPICLALIGPLGSEHHLIDVVDAVFKKRGHENFTVLTGETAFKVI